MEDLTISQVSKGFGVSTRMLRYYEKEGLIKSFRREDYAYRMYDEEAVRRLRQILLLRRLRIPLKQIGTILQSPSAVTAIEVFRQNISELDGEITALSTIRNILSRFVRELEQTAEVKVQSLLTEDEVLVQAIEALSLTSISFHKEDKTMENLTQAENRLNKLHDVRIVYLPPSAVAAAHHVGDDPEQHANDEIARFVRETGLHKRKPDLRHYGFNNPNPTEETDDHGYEAWVTIPDDMEVPPPLEKKRFPGGLYAAHMIKMGDFSHWQRLFDWVNESEQYEFAGDMADQEHMCGLLEEHLNYFSHISLEKTDPENLQLDLLMPVREKKTAR